MFYYVPLNIRLPAIGHVDYCPQVQGFRNHTRFYDNRFLTSPCPRYSGAQADCNHAGDCVVMRQANKPAHSHRRQRRNCERQCSPAAWQTA